MDLELSRVDYTVINNVAKNCVKLLPASGKEQQRIAVGDETGILQVISVKREDIHVHFKSLPGAKITSVQSSDSQEKMFDKIFVASGNEVRGYSKTGKLHFSFDSNMIEPILSMFVIQNHIFLCGNHVYNHYKDLKLIESYLCGDCIKDIVVVDLKKSERLISFIACEGRMIRTLEHARVTMSIETESIPNVLHIYNDADGDLQLVLFGSTDGRIGILDVNKLPSNRWLFKDFNTLGAVMSIASYDLSDSGVKNLIVGRQSGRIEVFSLDLSQENSTPITIYQYDCNESVMAVQAGVVGCQGYSEILVATSTGRLFGLTTQDLSKTIESNGNTSTNIHYGDTCSRINKLRNEIQHLRARVTKERERYRQLAQSPYGEFSVSPTVTINDSMLFFKELGSYKLLIECALPLDNVFLQSDVPLQISDIEKNFAVVSFTDSNPQEGNYLLAVYRCQLSNNRLEFDIRTIEGQSGTLQVYIIPLLQAECCQVKKYSIKPLSLHYRIYKFDEEKPLNILNVKGNFSLGEIHFWIIQTLPEVPKKPKTGESNILYFQSSLLGSTLSCNYSKGVAEFKSDNISTVSIIKESISKEASKKKIKIDFDMTVNDESINNILKQADLKLKPQIDLARKISVVEALCDLGLSDETASKSFTCTYQNLIKQQREIIAEYQSFPSYLDRLYGVITDLYVDYNKSKGKITKTKIPNLLDSLEQYSFKDLLMFFRPDLSEECFK